MNDQRVEQLKLSDLVPYARNSRTHTDDQIRRIAASISEFGWTNPVLIDGDGGIIAGHARVAAAQLLGMDVVPCIRLGHLTETQRKAYVIADNRLAEIGTGWNVEILRLEIDDIVATVPDFDAATIGWDEADLQDLLASIDEQPESDVDAEPQVALADQLREKWDVRPGDMWTMNDHRLMCGDSTDREQVLSLMGSDQADCVFTSPPYGVGIDYGETYQDTFDNLRAMLPVLAGLWMEIVQPGGFAVVNFADISLGKEIVGVDRPCEYPMALEYWPVFRSSGWRLWSRRIWCKNYANSSPYCMGTNRAAHTWEHIWSWVKDGSPMFNRQVVGDYSSQLGWFVSRHESALDVGLRDHSAVMALTPALYSIATHSRRDGLVIEPFCGTGTTLIACERLGRRCRAMEISPGYVAIALQRWIDATGVEPRVERA